MADSLQAVKQFKTVKIIETVPVMRETACTAGLCFSNFSEYEIRMGSFFKCRF